MKASWITIALLSLVALCLANETEIGIYYLDGTFQSGNPKLINTAPLITSIVLNDSIQIPLGTVRGYTDSAGFHLKLTDDLGLPFFVGRLIDGRISVYQSLQFRNGMAMMTMYYSLDNYSVNQLNYQSLEPLVRDNPRCRKQLTTYQFWNTLKLSCLVLAGGSATYAFIRKQTDGKEAADKDKILIGTFIGSICISILSHYTSDGYLLNAIREYNR